MSSDKGVFPFEDSMATTMGRSDKTGEFFLASWKLLTTLSLHQPYQP